jgi:hypothetical protein
VTAANVTETLRPGLMRYLSIRPLFAGRPLGGNGPSYLWAQVGISLDEVGLTAAGQLDNPMTQAGSNATTASGRTEFCSNVTYRDRSKHASVSSSTSTLTIITAKT